MQNFVPRDKHSAFRTRLSQQDAIKRIAVQQRQIMTRLGVRDRKWQLRETVARLRARTPLLSA